MDLLTHINDLPAIDSLEPLTPADEAGLAAVRAVLEQHGLLDRFGMTRLHKHFDLAAGEALIEMTDPAARIQTIRVMTGTELEGAEVVETAWRFYPYGTGAPVMGCIVACFGPNTKKCEYKAHTGVKT
jgi:hypothetical protein